MGNQLGSCATLMTGCSRSQARSCSERVLRNSFGVEVSAGRLSWVCPAPALQQEADRQQAQPNREPDSGEFLFDVHCSTSRIFFALRPRAKQIQTGIEFFEIGGVAGNQALGADGEGTDH